MPLIFCIRHNSFRIAAPTHFCPMAMRVTWVGAFVSVYHTNTDLPMLSQQPDIFSSVLR